ncbi:MAG: Eco57I restriction-modification methylase domain-containing protein [Candidatus Thorarchaeota archaeon]
MFTITFPVSRPKAGRNYHWCLPNLATYKNPVPSKKRDPHLKSPDKNVIDGFYRTLIDTREFLLQNLSGIDDHRSGREYINQLIMQLVFLRILQEICLLNENQNFLITNFKRNIQINHFNSFLDLFRHYFSVFQGRESPLHETFQYPDFPTYFPIWSSSNIPSIPDFCFYEEQESENSRRITPIPLLNLLESLDWDQIQDHSFFFGALYEKIITQSEKKSSGSYYTPQSVAEFICNRTLELFFLSDLNSRFSNDFQTMEEYFSSVPEAARMHYLGYLQERLQKITILDPAMGTGHFLECSARKLLQYYKMITDSSRGGEDKLYDSYSLLSTVILPKNLYGVDNDPLAVQISKVRMFLFLVSFLSDESSISKSSKNIDQIFDHFKVGDALAGFVSRNSKSSSDLSSYFSSSADDTDYSKNENLALEFVRQYRLKRKKPLKIEFFHWFNAFPDIFPEGIEVRGFDVIIANPPYLGESGNKELFRTYAKMLPRYYEGKMDLWYLFQHRIIDLLAQNGFATTLASNYWLTASGANYLRRRIMDETAIIEYINFADNKVFSNAQGIHTNIITIKRGRVENNIIQCILFDKTYPSEANLIAKIKNQLRFELPQNKLVFDQWDTYFHFLPEDIGNTIQKIIANSKPLKKCGFYVKEGIVTGLNKISRNQINNHNFPKSWHGRGVFILDQTKPTDLDTIRSFAAKELEFLKPFYKSSDIFKFSTQISTKKRILYLTRKTRNFEKLPNIERHLRKFGKALAASLDNPPYLNRPREQRIFSSPKIVTPQRTPALRFAYNTFDWYGGQDIYFIRSFGSEDGERLKGLLLLLNSKLAHFWFYWMGKRKGKLLEMFGDPLGYFPIPVKTNFGFLAMISEYLLFLNSLEANEGLKQQISDFFQKIADFIVIELYLRPHNSRFSTYIAKRLIPIDYRRWESLHYEVQQTWGNMRNVPDDYSQAKRKYFQIILDAHSSIQEDGVFHQLLDEFRNNMHGLKLPRHPILLDDFSLN